MKCPNCGASNGKTNKYCRECGTRLEVLAAPQDTHEPSTDEVALGEELFKVIELFEHGDLDAALEKGAKLAEANPNSGSAHSIVALVYERKAELELANDNLESSHQFLKLAIEHYERLIDLNPDSAADREKLAALRLKSTGNAAPPPAARVDLRRAMKAISPRWWAVGGAFLVVLFLVIFLTPPSQPKPQATAKVTETESRPRVDVTRNEPEQPGLKVYTFNPTGTASPSSAPRTPAPSVNMPKPRVIPPEVRPARVPKIDQEIDLVAEPSKSTPKKSAAEPAKAADKPAPEKASAPSGGTLLAQAIRLHNEGRDSEAIGAANQAVVLYQADVDAGRNVESASRGIKNAQKLMSVWQESGM